MRFPIDHTAESPLCRKCGSKGETVADVVGECITLTQTEFKGRHNNNVARCVHWQFCGKCILERACNWYEQKPEGVMESENFCGISQSSSTGKWRQDDPQGEIRSFRVRLYSGFLTETQVSASGNLTESPAEGHAGKSAVHITDTSETWHTCTT